MKVCPHCSGAYPVAEGFCPMDGTRLRTLHASDGGAPIGPGDAYASTLLGTVLDRRYRLDALIGEGGMGLVFRATHVLIGKPLAIKLLRPEHTSSPDVARRFLLEARVASSLKHPNVVEISDFGETGSGGAYYVMELLEGRTLAQSIDQSGPMSPPDAVITAAQICAGLSAAHALGIVHRDLKPDNVFLADPRHGAEHPVVKLLDFGIARAGPRRITVSGSVLGTPEYMSPEMAQGHDVDHRADLYALGVILFEMLTGTVPFYNREMAKTLELHVFGERPSLASRKPELARLQRIGELVGVLMSIDRDARPRDAGEVLRSLRAAWVQDLDAEAVAQVQRATLAMGSNRLPDIADAAGGAPWP
ncbi:MAG: serine/threonine protein kinase, partial [Deltaproteobacteria bacterium]|nr:serine/threonine protein kinase [Nannocystaceae bacterium]